MADSKTKWLRYPCKMKWAKVFAENMDPGNKDTNAGKTALKREGKYSIDMHITDQTKRRMEADGWPAEQLGNPTFKPADDYEGYPWFVRTHRYVKQNFKDAETGEFVRYGPPKVVNLNETFENSEGKLEASVWTYEDGELGNGTFGDVTISVFTGMDGDQWVQCLQKVAVREHVPYEAEEIVYY